MASLFRELSFRSTFRIPGLLQCSSVLSSAPLHGDYWLADRFRASHVFAVAPAWRSYQRGFVLPQ